MDAEQNYMIERREGDEMIRMTLMDGQVRVMMCETTQMVQRAADIHNATPVCTAAMGRLMTATSMLSVMMKGERESVTVNIKGGGPMGTLTAVGDHGDIKVCADDTQVELPLRADGKLDVGTAIGKDGYMTVIKDLVCGSRTSARSSWCRASWASTLPTTIPYPSSPPRWWRWACWCRAMRCSRPADC